MNWKLTTGKLRDAWLAYPSQRRAYRSVPAGKPILLTGTHRSGTTWLAKMLAASGIWYVHEPFFPGKGRWPRSFEFRESGTPDVAVDALFTDVLAGGFRQALNLPNADHPLMPLRLIPPMVPRMLVKDPIACLLSEYLTRRFDLQTLILFRHPAGFAASVCRLGWPRGAFLRQFLADEPLMTAHLEPYRALLERYAAEDTLASATVLHGALSCVLWRWVEEGVGTPVVFEELCADPIMRLRSVFDTLHLPYDEEIADAHRTACFGSARAVGDYHPHSVNRNSLAMARSWTTQLDDAELGGVRGIWDTFGIPLYCSDADWDRKGYLLGAATGQAA